MFQSRSEQEKPPSGPSLRALTTSTRHSTSTSPSTAPVDTPVSAYSLEEPSYALSYAKDRDQSIAPLPVSQRETRPNAAPTKKEPSPDSKIALGEMRRDKPSGGEDRNLFGCMRESHPTTKSVTPFQESGKTGEGIGGSSSVRAPSDGQANATGEPMGMSPGDPPARMSSVKGKGKRAIRAPIDDVPSLEAKVAEAKVRIEELKATREILDKERNALTSKKEDLRVEISRYVRMKKERSKSSLRTAPAQRSHSSTTPAPSKDAEGTTSILSALFLLHSIVTFDTLQ